MKTMLWSTAALAAVLTFSGCSAMSSAQAPGNLDTEANIVKTAGDQNTGTLRKAVAEAAEKAGWNVSQIDDLSLIASRYSDGKSASVLMTLHDDGVHFEKNRSTMSDSDFADAMEQLEKRVGEALLKTAPSH